MYTVVLGRTNANAGPLILHYTINVAIFVYFAHVGERKESASGPRVDQVLDDTGDDKYDSYRALG